MSSESINVAVAYRHLTTLRIYVDAEVLRARTHAARTTWTQILRWMTGLSSALDALTFRVKVARAKITVRILRLALYEALTSCHREQAKKSAVEWRKRRRTAELIRQNCSERLVEVSFPGCAYDTTSSSTIEILAARLMRQRRAAREAQRESHTYIHTTSLDSDHVSQLPWYLDTPCTASTSFRVPTRSMA